jgi:hypothetical protein
MKAHSQAAIGIFLLTLLTGRRTMMAYFKPKIVAY